jgi:uracil-DNA glycosylase
VKNGNAITISIQGQEVQTLRDLLPEVRGLNILFVAKAPAPSSIRTGHYFQGSEGRLFWKVLKQYRILAPTTEFEDDSLLRHGYGLTDIAKKPRSLGREPSLSEYRSGAHRIMWLIWVHQPKVVVFVYKRVLDKVLHCEFGITRPSSYGFNPALEQYFGCQVFAFPLPHTRCTREHATAAMQELADVCTQFTQWPNPTELLFQEDSQPEYAEATTVAGS